MSGQPDIAGTVRELLEDLDLFRLPVVPQEVCRRLGVAYQEVPYEGIEGTLLVVGAQALIAVNSNNREASRRAFTCAHELGHYSLDIDDGMSSFSCSTDDVSDRAAEQRELRANEFAAELLMPADLIRPLIEEAEPSWERITELANLCGASVQAMAQRFIELSPQHCWLAIIRDQKVWRYRKQSDSPLHISPKGWSSKWRNRYPGSSEIPAFVWFGRGRHTRDRVISQAFLPENRYGETLVLLWDKQGHFERSGDQVIPVSLADRLKVFGITAVVCIAFFVVIALLLRSCANAVLDSIATHSPPQGQVQKK